MRQKRTQTAEEIDAWAVIHAADAAREKAARQAKRVQRAYRDLLKALQLPLTEQATGAQDRVLDIVTAIVAAEESLKACEKALAKPARGWDKVETSVGDVAPTQEAAE